MQNSTPGTVNKEDVQKPVSEAPVQEVIYLALDVLLDVRLGTIALHSQEMATETLRSGKAYFDRRVDEFPGLSRETFRELYNRRDKEALKRSVVTNISFFVRRLIKDSLVDGSSGPNQQPLVFEVNTWPYDFDAAENDMLRLAVVQMVMNSAQVRIVHRSLEELTPNFVRENYQIMVMYDWLEWLKVHQSSFDKGGRGMPTVTIAGPELFYPDPPKEEDILKEPRLKTDYPFRVTERLFAPLFALKLLPVSLFSVTERLTPENAADAVAIVSVTQEEIMEHLEEKHPGAKVIEENILPTLSDIAIAPEDDSGFDPL